MNLLGPILSPNYPKLWLMRLITITLMIHM